MRIPTIVGLTGLLAASGTTGSTTWGFLIPPAPGLVIGLRAVILSPAGMIPFGSGVFGQTTRALQVTIG
jgi:hypothetical protein